MNVAGGSQSPPYSTSTLSDKWFGTSGDAINNNSGVIMHAVYNSPSYASDSSAATGGVEIGELYRSGNDVKIRMS